MLQDLEQEVNPAEIATRVHEIVRRHVDAGDPYLEAKRSSTKEALGWYPRLQKLVAESADPMETAIRLSIAGNIIDFGVADQIGSLETAISNALSKPFAIDHCNRLLERLGEVEFVLFLADNAGETVFDRVLIERIEMPVIYAVKGGPILNDATLEDAVEAGVDRCATIIENGSQAPGTILSRCSEQFRNAFNEAPLIIAKGQGNYETLSDAGDKVFCLLQVKCAVIAEDIGAPVGSMIVRQSR